MGRLPLVCLPHAGGGLARYRGWRADLPDDVEVVLPRLPGREGRLFDEPYPDVATAAEHVLRQLEPTGPVAVAGISYGALVAYELAARLEASGTPVHAVFAASQRAPATPLPGVGWHALDDDRLLSELIALGGLSPELAGEGEYLQLFLPVIRAELHASETYRRPLTHGRLRAPLFCYHGSGDAAIPPSSARGWSAETERFGWRSIDAEHFLLGADGTDHWLAALRTDLAALVGQVAGRPG